MQLHQAKKGNKKKENEYLKKEMSGKSRGGEGERQSDTARKKSARAAHKLYTVKQKKGALQLLPKYAQWTGMQHGALGERNKDSTPSSSFPSLVPQIGCGALGSQCLGVFILRHPVVRNYWTNPAEFRDMNNMTHHRGERHLEAVDAGQTKVGQFDLSSAGDQDVLGFQVTVDHAVRMQEVQPLEQLVHHIL
ncbi:hypothetical protein EYF80_027436 [Liparis tanakae]|uniref:Uncharacterized protein n=1 Tax=Liparis tanakae TaxID=230148 RepID=A0A4Z2H924_9TELE|nr:hypothetical protein EYF80_027436 [Liparis tanakae]